MIRSSASAGVGRRQHAVHADRDVMKLPLARMTCPAENISR
jgi:hypothetical protein